MSRPSSTLTVLTSVAAIGLVLAIVPGCTHGRGYYGFHWSYCKFFGYPKLLGCIEPPSAAQAVLPDESYPHDDRDSIEKAELGKLLFFDKRLSSTGTVSCASCHVPDKGFADPRRLSVGINGQTGRRNAPTVLNTAFHPQLFWDGRAQSLEEQAVGPIENEKEMGPSGNLAQAVDRLNDDPDMKARFQRAFKTDVTAKGIAMAIATFERKLKSRETAFEQWVREKEPMPSWSAERGWEVFRGRGQCAVCHPPPLYTGGLLLRDKNSDFRRIGVSQHPADAPDMGRHEYLASLATRGQPVDPQEAEKSKCAFKTPSLLNVRETAPYMHNGTLETLEDVVAFYARFDPLASYARSDSQADDPACGKPDPQLAPIRGMLTPDEQMDLVEFLRSLSPAVGVYREFLKHLDLPASPQKAANAIPPR